MVEDDRIIDDLARNIQAGLDDEWYAVRTWQELMPDMVGLMMLYERMREFGILMSLGMKRSKLAVMGFIGSRIVLTFHDLNGEIISALFRVEGIFQSFATAYELGTVFVESAAFNELLGDADIVTEIALRLYDQGQSQVVANALKEAYPELLVRTWMDIAPDLQFVVEVTEVSMLWIMAIILLGVWVLAF